MKGESLIFKEILDWEKGLGNANSSHAGFKILSLLSINFIIIIHYFNYFVCGQKLTTFHVSYS